MLPMLDYLINCLLCLLELFESRTFFISHSSSLGNISRHIRCHQMLFLVSSHHMFCVCSITYTEHVSCSLYVIVVAAHHRCQSLGALKTLGPACRSRFPSQLIKDPLPAKAAELLHLRRHVCLSVCVCVCV